jgi:hypothetical protein
MDIYNSNEYVFSYRDLSGRNITHSVRTDEAATPQDVFEHFCDFLSGVYGWNVKEYFEDTTS